VVIERALGVREVRVFSHPDSAGRDTPGTGRGFVESDPLCVEHRTHVVGHVTQVQKQLGHGAMLITSVPFFRSFVMSIPRALVRRFTSRWPYRLPFLP